MPNANQNTTFSMCTSQDVSDSIEKSWDHPWSTEEMRKKRREWSLAGDVGLLKHLQQFSENLMSKANKTQTALDTLTTQLQETAILVDNVSNTSLALANTQFIESRVQEDDIEVKEDPEDKHENSKTQESAPEDLIASISKSVKQGLNLMDEKYKVLDVACSDSEDDDGGAMVFSVIVGPNDPYQDRPLPYVIGSDKWIKSNKIGLESSSSSESEQMEEEREESESDKEDISVQRVFNRRHKANVNIARLSSSSSDSDNYNDPSNSVSYMNDGKMDTMSENNINFASESVTPNNASKISSETTPNFAEELAKRLGTVRQTPVNVDEANESLVNRSNDDLFTPEKNVFDEKSDNLFSHKKRLFDEEVSANLWQNKPIRTYQSNIIPPSMDVPPPINIISTKPKSAIDDLFADADSEDSDSIFSSSNTKKRTKESSASNNVYSTGVDDMARRFLDVAAPGASGNVVTSTPESNVNTSYLFSDDENDDGDLFGNLKKQSHKAANVSTPANTMQESDKKKPIDGVSRLGSVLVSEIESTLSSRKMRRQLSDSSDNDMPGNYDSARSTEPTSGERAVLNDNIVVDRSSVVTAENPAENISAINENSNSSGISTQPPSIDNTAESGLWLNFQPEMSSTRLKSEEIYRERVSSDSLFVARTRDPANFSSANINNEQPRQEQREQNVSSALLQDDVFENDNLFGPPPSKSDTKRVKSKVSSLFDDSDSGDELFSATSSGSRSQKSTDFLAAVPSSDKTKPIHRGSNLFDDDVDIFGDKDCPDVDIFGVVSKSMSKDVVSDGPFDSRDTVMPKDGNFDKVQSSKMEPKKIGLFDDDDGDDLFTAKPKSGRKTDIFDEDDDLFLSAKASDKSRSAVEKDRSIRPNTDAAKDAPILNTEEKNRINSPADGLFPSAAKTRNFLFEDDNYEDLFGNKDTAIRKEDKSKSESKKEIKENFVERIQRVPENNERSTDSSGQQKPTDESNAIVTQIDTNRKNRATVQDTPNVVKDITVDGITKRSPPKTLSIRTLPTSSEESGQAPRKAVSGKIKNLMGKVGDLKILSPMDAPPTWRRSEDKTDEDEDVVDRDSDSGAFGIPGHVSPPSISEDSARKESSHSTISTASNAEVAISFDDMAHVETLSTTASKSRVRIQAKRRPQSRHARKSALRQSGIDFDTVDNADNDSHEESHVSTFSHSSTKDSSSSAPVSADRLAVNDNVQRIADPSSGADDKSELGSISKESSMSVNRNTLLSPSTDEEDLFDVPPDLPEDPQREDTLFGRAPILSPVDGTQSEQTPVYVGSPMDTLIGKVKNTEIDVKTVNKSNEIVNAVDDHGESARSEISGKLDRLESCEKRDNERKEIVHDKQEEAKKESSQEPNDPLRDSSHDPLQNHSQLFAFVTKTPSPEKGKCLLFSEDDSLFSSGAKKPNEEPPQKRETLDLFADDADGDLFSAPLKKTLKKPLRDTNISLFDDGDIRNDDDDDLFGGAPGKASTKLESTKSTLAQTGRKKNTIFDDDDDDDDSSLFVESSGQSQKSDNTSISEAKQELADSAKNSNLKDIFGEPPCEDDDIFAAKKIIPKKVAPSKSLFASDDDEDDSHIFGKPSVSTDLKAKTIANRPAVKKGTTRDLKITAEKTVEDPLSLLQDD